MLCNLYSSEEFRLIHDIFGRMQIMNYRKTLAKDILAVNEQPFLQVSTADMDISKRTSYKVKGRTILFLRWGRGRGGDWAVTKEIFCTLKLKTNNSSRPSHRLHEKKSKEKNASRRRLRVKKKFKNRKIAPNRPSPQPQR